MKKIILIMFVMFLVFAISVYADLNTNLSNYYDFEQDPASSDLIDQVGGMDSTSDTVTARVTGKNNYGWNFTADSDSVQLPISLVDDKSAVSWRCWAMFNYTTSHDGQAVLYGQAGDGNDMGVYSSNAGKFIFIFNTDNDWTEDVTTVDANNYTWYQIVQTYDGASVKGYINGSEVSDESATGLVDMDVAGQFGVGWHQSIYFMDGVVDECAFWNRTLTGAEVLDDYNSGVGRFYPNLVPSDSTPPKSNITINNTSPAINGIVNVTANVSDETAVDACLFWNNMSNTNSSAIDLSGAFDHHLCHNITTINVTGLNDVLFRVYVNDTTGNWNYSNLVVTTIDNVLPNSNITINDTTHLRKNDYINISLNVSDTKELSYCWFYSNLSHINSSLISLSGQSDHHLCHNVTKINVSKGDGVKIIGYVNDTSGNLNYSVYEFTVNNTPPPTVTIFGQNQNYTNSTNASLHWTAVTDVDGDIVEYFVYHNNSVFFYLYTNSTDTNFTMNHTSHGEITRWKVATFDGTNFGENSTLGVVTLDIESPTLTWNDTYPYYTTELSFSANVTCIDGGGVWLFNGSVINASDVQIYSFQSVGINQSSYYNDTNMTIEANSNNTIRIICYDSGGSPDILNNTYNVSNALLTFRDKTELSNTYDVEYGYYSVGKVKRLTENQINNFNVNVFTKKVGGDWHFGALFDLPASDFIFGFRIPDTIPKLSLLHSENAHFILYDRYYIDFDAKVCHYNGSGVLSNCKSGSPAILQQNDHYHIYYNYDLKNWFNAGERLVFYTESTGALNKVEENNTVVQDSTNPIVNAINLSIINNTKSRVSNIIFSFNATDDNPRNATLWINYTAWLPNQTIAWNSNENTSFASISLPDGTYLWNVEVNDTVGNIDVFDVNHTITIDATAPTISLESPTNYQEFQDRARLDFRYNVSDSNNISSCDLFLDGSLANSSTSITKDTPQYFNNTIVLDTREQKWKVECNDTFGNVVNSSEYIFDIAITVGVGGGGGSGTSGVTGQRQEVVGKKPKEEEKKEEEKKKNIFMSIFENTIGKVDLLMNILRKIFPNEESIKDDGICQANENIILNFKDCNKNNVKELIKQAWFTRFMVYTILLMNITHLFIENRRFKKK